MQHDQLKEMPLEQLWNLHEAVSIALSRKISLEKAKLEERLRKISMRSGIGEGSIERKRREYPKVLPKYRNPKNPSVEVVEDDVKLAIRKGGNQAVHDAEELDAPPPLGMRRDDLSGGDFERGEQGCRHLPVIGVL